MSPRVSRPVPAASDAAPPNPSAQAWPGLGPCWWWAGLAAAALLVGFGTYQWQGRDFAAPPSAMDRAPSDAADRVQQVLRQGKPTIVEFGSTRCVSCREMKPLLAQLAREHGERVAVVDIDVLAEREYLRRYGIVVIPTQVFFDATGRETSRHAGKIELRDMLARLGASPPRDGS